MKGSSDEILEAEQRGRLMERARVVDTLREFADPNRDGYAAILVAADLIERTRTDGVDPRMASLRAEWIKQQMTSFDDVLSSCDSPIERLFVAALMLYGWGSSFCLSDWKLWSAESKKAGVIGFRRMLLMQDGGGAFFLQANVTLARAYRIDCAFVGFGGRVAIEFDGHEFHERTKEQARRDKSRDRDLTRAGWRCIRFTGSEIYADPWKCVVEALQIVEPVE